MVKSTIIARVADGLPLAASMDDEESEDLTEYKNQAKLLFKRLRDTEPRASLESGPYTFQYVCVQQKSAINSTSYLIDQGVCYLCLCDKSYPKKLAFAFLEELQREFQEKYGPEVGTVSRPYAFVKFGTYNSSASPQEANGD